MGESELQQQIAAAEAYESFFVPALFRDWASRVAETARIGAGDRVLDVACGTGALAREAARRVGSAGTVAGLDVNPGMLAVARRCAPGIEWRQGTAEELPWADGAFDVVASQFGLMFFADRQRALREMLRVLAPGGRLAVAVWDAIDRAPAYAAELGLVERIAGARAGDALRAPFALGDGSALAALAAAAGIPGARVASCDGRARFPSVRAMVEVDLRGWLPTMGVILDERRIAEILVQADAALRPHVTRAPDGAIEFPCPALLLTAFTPVAT